MVIEYGSVNSTFPQHEPWFLAQGYVNPSVSPSQQLFPKEGCEATMQMASAKGHVLKIQLQTL